VKPNKFIRGECIALTVNQIANYEDSGRETKLTAIMFDHELNSFSARRDFNASVISTPSTKLRVDSGRNLRSLTFVRDDNPLSKPCDTVSMA